MTRLVINYQLHHINTGSDFFFFFFLQACVLHLRDRRGMDRDAPQEWLVATQDI